MQQDSLLTKKFICRSQPVLQGPGKEQKKKADFEINKK